MLILLEEWPGRSLKTHLIDLIRIPFFMNLFNIHIDEISVGRFSALPYEFPYNLITINNQVYIEAKHLLKEIEVILKCSWMIRCCFSMEVKKCSHKGYWRLIMSILPLCCDDEDENGKQYGTICPLCHINYYKSDKFKNKQ